MRWLKRRQPKEFGYDVLSHGGAVFLQITGDGRPIVTLMLTGKDARTLAGHLLDAARAVGCTGD